MTEKQYYLFFIAGVICSLGIIATFSYIEDPANMFHNGVYEKGVASILLSGKNFEHYEYYDDRMLQKELIAQDAVLRDTIVLGSSRSMQIQGAGSFFNNAVYGASIEDNIAIIGMYEDRNKFPKTIILGVDPWVFNKYSTQDRWEILFPEYEREAIKMGIVRSEVKYDLSKEITKRTSLISQSIVKKSIEKLFDSQTDVVALYTTSIESEMGLKLTDGTISFDSETRNRGVLQVDGIAREDCKSDLYALGNYTDMDVNLKGQFEGFVKYLKANNTVVIIYLPPYHPIIYKEIETNPKYTSVLESERYIKKFASENNIQIIGSYNPIILNLTSSDFYDGKHPNRNTTLKLTQSLLNTITNL